MSNGNGSNGSLKIPLGLIGVLVTLGVSFTGFWGLWSVARADVDNLKSRVSSLETIPAQMSSMQTDIDSIKSSQSEMRQDIKILLQRSR